MPDRRNQPTADEATALAEAQTAEHRGEEPPRPDDTLRPFDPPEGQGQTLSPTERGSNEARARLAQARLESEQNYNQVQQEIRNEERRIAEEELGKARKAAMDALEETDAAYAEQMRRVPGGGSAVHPQWLELEGARVRALADALQQDETVPGGIYIVDGRKVDANGRALE